MELNLAGKNALIIGGGHGSGFCLAEKLLHEGAHVCATALSITGLKKLTLPSDSKSKLLLFAEDLVPEKAEYNLLNFLNKKKFYPDIIVHCMGGQPAHKPKASACETWREWYRRIFEIPLSINEELLPIMRKKGWGRIIHTGSVASLEAQGLAPYTSFKALLAAYTRTTGRQEAKHGVIMTTVLPGAFTFPGSIWDRISIKDPSATQDFLEQRQSIGRLGTADEIADFMLFLCSEKASFNAGGIYPVDGGLGTAFFQP